MVVAEDGAPPPSAGVSEEQVADRVRREREMAQEREDKLRAEQSEDAVPAKL